MEMANLRLSGSTLSELEANVNLEVDLGADLSVIQKAHHNEAGFPAAKLYIAVPSQTPSSPLSSVSSDCLARSRVAPPVGHATNTRSGASDRDRDRDRDHPNYISEGRTAEDTNPQEIQALWQRVYQTKRDLEAIMAPTVPSFPTGSSRIGDIVIDSSPQCIISEEHFGTYCSFQIKPQPNDSFLDIITKRGRHQAHRTLDELKLIVGYHLATQPDPFATTDNATLAHPLETAGGGVAWSSVRFLQLDPLRNKNSGGVDWQLLPHPLPINGQKDQPPQQRTNSSASITFWLSPQNSKDKAFVMRLQGSTYVVGEGHAVCPYLSIEYLTDSSDPIAEATAINTLASTGGAALYNRFLLREKMLAKRNDAGRENKGVKAIEHENDEDTIRHYCIIVGWDSFSVWTIQPNNWNNTAVSSGSAFANHNGGGTESAEMSRTAPPSSSKAPATPSRLKAMKPHPPWQQSAAPSTQACQVDNKNSSNRDRAYCATASNPGGLGSRPKTPSNWNGARMTRLLGGDINELSKDLLLQWIEQIHRWGTTRYADAVARDVNLALSSSGAGTGGFGMMTHPAAAAHHDGLGDELPLEELESREWRE